MDLESKRQAAEERAAGRKRNWADGDAGASAVISEDATAEKVIVACRHKGCTTMIETDAELHHETCAHRPFACSVADCTSEVHWQDFRAHWDLAHEGESGCQLHEREAQTDRGLLKGNFQNPGNVIFPVVTMAMKVDRYYFLFTSNTLLDHSEVFFVHQIAPAFGGPKFKYTLELFGKGPQGGKAGPEAASGGFKVSGTLPCVTRHVDLESTEMNLRVSFAVLEQLSPGITKEDKSAFHLEYSLHIEPDI